MAKSISDYHEKKRGRPKTTGTTPMSGVRFPTEMEAEITKWAGRQSDKPAKAEAVRRLVMLGLAASTPKPKAKR
jgi:hypothetical protein